jgi:hypothetical protein
MYCCIRAQYLAADYESRYGYQLGMKASHRDESKKSRAGMHTDLYRCDQFDMKKEELQLGCAKKWD